MQKMVRSWFPRRKLDSFPMRSVPHNLPRILLIMQVLEIGLNVPLISVDTNR